MTDDQEPPPPNYWMLSIPNRCLACGEGHCLAPVDDPKRRWSYCNVCATQHFISHDPESGLTYELAEAAPGEKPADREYVPWAPPNPTSRDYEIRSRMVAREAEARKASESIRVRGQSIVGRSLEPSYMSVRVDVTPPNWSGAAPHTVGMAVATIIGTEHSIQRLEVGTKSLVVFMLVEEGDPDLRTVANRCDHLKELARVIAMPIGSTNAQSDSAPPGDGLL